MFIFVSLFSASSFAQKEIKAPTIEGTPAQNVAPNGWWTAGDSPDIIKGNGPWPGGGYDVSHVNGGVPDGKSMGLFLANKSTQGEGWKTKLKGLKIGKEYSITFMWQQCKLYSGTSVVYEGGDLLIQAGDKKEIYKSDGDLDDGWQTVTFTFIAKSSTTELWVNVNEVDSGATGVTGSAIAIDNVGVPQAAPF